MTTNQRRTLHLWLFAALPFALGVSSGRARADYVGNKYTEPGTGLVLEYNIYVPTGYDPAKKYPLMVVLHAANTNQIPPPRTLSSDGKGWAPLFIGTAHQATDPSFFMIPISQTNMGGWGRPDQPITTEEMFEGRLTVQVLKSEVMTKYSIDPARLYITGPSMGARGTWDIIRRYPNMFAAAAPAAGPALPEDAPLYLNQNIWAICGEVDPIVQGERDAITAIRKLGGNPIYTELAGHGHDSWRTVYPDPQFVPWMFAQRLGVPWWTVSKAPVAVAGATLTTGWPTTMPPANLPSSFGGAPGASGASGTTGAGGAPAPIGGTSNGGASSGGVPGVAGSSGNGGASATSGPSGTGATGVSGGVGPVLSSTGGATGSPSSSGGAPSSGGASSTSTSAASGGAGTVTAGSAGPSGSGATSGGGCSYVRGRAGLSSVYGGLLAIASFALRRRRRS